MLISILSLTCPDTIGLFGVVGQLGYFKFLWADFVQLVQEIASDVLRLTYQWKVGLKSSEYLMTKFCIMCSYLHSQSAFFNEESRNAYYRSNYFYDAHSLFERWVYCATICPYESIFWVNINFVNCMRQCTKMSDLLSLWLLLLCFRVREHNNNNKMNHTCRRWH